MSRGALQDVPLSALFDEVRRRCRADRRPAVVRVGELLRIDVANGRVRWQGASYNVTSGECDVLVALAAAYPSGLTAVDLGRHLLGGDPLLDAATVRSRVWSLRRHIPGLVPLIAPRRRGLTEPYRLDLEPAVPIAVEKAG